MNRNRWQDKRKEAGDSAHLYVLFAKKTSPNNIDPAECERASSAQFNRKNDLRYVSNSFSYCSTSLEMYWSQRPVPWGNMSKIPSWCVWRCRARLRVCRPCFSQFCHVKPNSVLHLVYTGLSMFVVQLQEKQRRKVLRVKWREPFHQPKLSQAFFWIKILHPTKGIPTAGIVR